MGKRTLLCRVYFEPCDVCQVGTSFNRSRRKYRFCSAECAAIKHAEAERSRYARDPEIHINRSRSNRAKELKACAACGRPTGGKLCQPCTALQASKIARERALSRPRVEVVKPKKSKQEIRDAAKERAKSQRSALRAAYEDKNREAFFVALEDRCETNEIGCWLWIGKSSKESYSFITWGGKGYAVHRLSVEMRDGHIDPLTPVVHHMCANRRCVNPDHLQPVTHRENNAEMMQRNSYLRRIEQLEAALAVAIPDHELLKGANNAWTSAQTSVAA